MWIINSTFTMKTHINRTNNTRLAKRLNASGMTLIEISLVIALLLGLIAVVFLGLGTYLAIVQGVEPSMPTCSKYALVCLR